VILLVRTLARGQVMHINMNTRLFQHIVGSAPQFAGRAHKLETVGSARARRRCQRTHEP
jgi:hypothetical protein